MKHHPGRRVAVALIFLGGSLFGQPWSGVLAPSRAINWNNAGAGTIPTNRAQCGSTISAYGTSGSPASPATINNAIAACGSGQFVQLGAGTFYLNAGIVFNSGTTSYSNVTLRGMGANQTVIVFYGNAGCDGAWGEVCVHNGDSIYAGGPGTTANWTAGYSAGTITISLSNYTNLKVGSLIFLDQYTDTYAISTITCAGGIATATIGTNTFSMGNGRPVVTVQGVNPTGYNSQPNGQTSGTLYEPGSYPVTAVTSTTVSYNLGATCPSAYVSGGTITLDDGALTITNDSSFSSAEPVQGNNPGRPGNSGSTNAVTMANWSANGGGTATITTSNLAFLNYGTLINVSNVQPSGYQIVEHGVTGSTSNTLSYAMATNPGTFSGSGTVNAFACSAPGGGYQCRPGVQANIVAACGATTYGAACTSGTVTLQSPIYDPHIRADRSPGAWWGSELPITGVGVENMTLDSSNQKSGNIVAFYNAVNSWVKGLRTIEANSSHVLLMQSAHITVRDSYLYGNQGHGSTSSQSYCTDTYTGASDNLIENNIYQHCAVAMQNETGMGNVYGYNFAVDNDNGASPGYPLGMASQHAPGIMFNLWEGNFLTSTSRMDAFHGNGSFANFFRNRMTGWEPGRNTQTIALMIQTGSRQTNIVGNVLGVAGYHTQYEWLYGTNAGNNDYGCSASVLAFGWGGLCDSRIATNNYNTPAVEMDDPQANPPNAAAPGTAMVWGNYDVVSNAVRWNSNEVPSSLPIYANPVPSSHTLPNSFYGANFTAFSTTPWGTVPNPPIGPDVSGGAIAGPYGVGGYANMLPSMLTFLNTTPDPAYSVSSSVTNATCTGGVATLTIGAQAANVDPGSVIAVSGMSPSGYNVAQSALTQVTATTATTVSYSVPSCPSGSGSGGTATVPLIVSFNAANSYSSVSITAPPATVTATVH